MIEVRQPSRTEEIRQTARHTLFVEGAGSGGLDQTVLRELLPRQIRVRALGPSFHVRSVAEALYVYHPDYYFLIDRDHHDDQFVEGCWNSFPDPEKSNLLVWRRRELENYFLIPEYLAKLDDPEAAVALTVTGDELCACILECCRQRVYLDAANLTIIELRESLKETWIQTFERVSDFATKEAAIDMLNNLPQFQGQISKVSDALQEQRVIDLFEEILGRFTGGCEPLEFTHGQWLHVVRGKRVLPTVVNRCFRARDRTGTLLQGDVRQEEVMKALVRKPLDDQPDDFRQLHSLMSERIKSP